MTAPARRYFVAGTMQGSRRGADMLEQSYRETITEIVRDVDPAGVVVDPAALLAAQLGEQWSAIMEEHARLATVPVVDRTALSPLVATLIDAFHRLVDEAAACDACIAYLPDHEPSMGTMAEMFAAHRAGAFVVSVTDMRQNLAVLACSDVIVPDLARLRAHLGRAALVEPGAPA